MGEVPGVEAQTFAIDKHERALKRLEEYWSTLYKIGRKSFFFFFE